MRWNTVIGLALLSAAAVRAQTPPAPAPSFQELLRRLSTASAESCGGEKLADPNDENQLFGQAGKALTESLNDANPGSPDPKSRVAREVGRLEQLSQVLNQSWPDENRFHAEVIDVSPGLIVTMTIRSRATFFFFAADKPAHWQTRGFDMHLLNFMGGSESVDIFPLQRGPSAGPRFLAEVDQFACGSGRGITYTAYEWDPEDADDLSEVIKVEDAVNQEDPVEEQIVGKSRTDSLAPIGRLQTDVP